MENAKASINYQRLNENIELTAFADTSKPNPVTPDAEPPLPVDLLDPKDIEDIVEESALDNAHADPDDDLTEEEINEIVDDIVEDIIDDIEEINPNPLTPDDLNNDPADPADPNEPPDPRLIDSDGDDVNNEDDAFPFDANETEDFDRDNIGDNADKDDDNDFVEDDLDAFPHDKSESIDTDNDGLGNNIDLDDDADGLLDTVEAILGTDPLLFDTDLDTIGDGMDAFPLDVNEHLDSDFDGVGDNADIFPFNGNENADNDGDNIGNNADEDDDNDGLNDIAESIIGTDPFNSNTDGDDSNDLEDAYPLNPEESLNSDGDALGNNADPDDDNDGLSDSEEINLGTAPLNPDSDNDGISDLNDAFPLNASESSDNDNDGIGNNEDTDDDNDNVLDTDDPAPFDDTISGDVSEITDIGLQDFQYFYTGQSWYLTDFGLPEDSARDEYLDINGNILFDIEWTKRTLNHMADLLEMDRSLMSREFANALCIPKIQVGKASVYGVGSYDNMVVELDTDLGDCLIGASEPANVRLRSFIPTKVGYEYAVTAQYQMRDYNMPINAYRHFVMRFGSTAEHFPPVFNGFVEAKIEIVATHKYSRLVLRDNGLPDSYGILVDDIKVTELGQVDHYQACANIFDENSKGFRKCIAGEVDYEQSCTTENLQVHNYKPGPNVSEDRQILKKAFIISEPVQGDINFLTLGKAGKLDVRCYIDGYPATVPIFNKTISFRDIHWGAATPESYPEQARVSAKLSHCVNDELNKNHQLGLVSTNEVFSYDFTHHELDGSYEGCRLKKLLIRDKTPESNPSTDGFDINSIIIRDTE